MYPIVVHILSSIIPFKCYRESYHPVYYDKNVAQLLLLGFPGQDPNSPYVYLKEIILVDDNSTLPELKGKLSYYIRTRLPPDMIRILRLPDRYVHFCFLASFLAWNANYSTNNLINVKMHVFNI